MLVPAPPARADASLVVVDYPLQLCRELLQRTHGTVVATCRQPAAAAGLSELQATAAAGRLVRPTRGPAARMRPINKKNSPGPQGTGSCPRGQSRDHAWPLLAECVVPLTALAAARPPAGLASGGRRQ